MPPGEPVALRPVGPDRIFVDGLVRSIAAGILPEEQGTPQRVRFAVSLELAPGAQPCGDEPAVSYTDIVDAVDTLTQGQTMLLEHLGEALAARLLANPLAQRVSITIEKLDRLGGAGTLGIQMTRERAA